MRKIKLLIVAAVFGLVGLSIVSCPGASPSAKTDDSLVSAIKIALENSQLEVGRDLTTYTMGEPVALPITIYNAKAVESWQAGVAGAKNATSWIKFKATADGEEQEFPSTLGIAASATVTRTEGKEDVITIILSGAFNKAWSGILTQVEIDPETINGNPKLSVKFGETGIGVTVKNAGAKVDGETGIVIKSGITADGTEDEEKLGEVAYSVTTALDLTKLVPQNNNASLVSKDDAPVDGTPDITSLFPGLSGKHIVAKLLRVDSLASTKKLVVGFFTEAGSNVQDATNKPTAGMIESAFEIPGTAYGDDTAGAKITIEDAVKIYVPAKYADRKAATDEKTVSGQTGFEVDPVIVTITLTGDYFNDGFDPADEGFDISNIVSIADVPAGLVYELAQPIKAFDQSFKLKISGTPTAAVDENDKYREIRVASGSILSNSDIVIASNDTTNNKLGFAISDTPTGTISENIIISGTVGTVLKNGQTNYEIPVSITPNQGHLPEQSDFAAKTKAENDLDDWFELPAGLHASLKADIVAGATSFVAVITGTPTEASSKNISIKIPANAWRKRGDNDDMVDGGLILVVEGTDFQTWDIAGSGSFDKGISGTAETALADQVITLTVDGDTFKTAIGQETITTDTSLKNYIVLPLTVAELDDYFQGSANWDIKPSVAPTEGATSLACVLTGTPRTGVSMKIKEIMIAGPLLTSGLNATVKAEGKRIDIGPAAYVKDVEIELTDQENIPATGNKIRIKLVGARFGMLNSEEDLLNCGDSWSLYLSRDGQDNVDLSEDVELKYVAGSLTADADEAEFIITCEQELNVNNEDDYNSLPILVHIAYSSLMKTDGTQALLGTDIRTTGSSDAVMTIHAVD